MVDNGRVVSNVVARGAAKVMTEKPKAGVELLKHDGLSLHFTDLLSDDPLGHLLQDEEALLDDLDGLGVANEFLGLLGNECLGGYSADEVVGSVEVIEVSERRVATPVVEGDIATGGYKSMLLKIGSFINEYIFTQSVKGMRSSGNACDQSRGDGDNFEELGEHFFKE